jgi:glycosyltransferase involved in cell wall biosynthesis
VDRLLPVSSFVARKLVEGGFAPERITVRHQGIEDAGASRPPGTGAVFVGRLDTEKGVEELLTAWVTGGFEAETLTLVGDGPLRARAERLAATTSGLTVLGSIPPREVREVMLRSAFVVIPSRWYEGLPRAAVEALMLGRPIVASDIGSLRDLVSADVGWLTAPTAAGIIDGLRRAFADPELTAKGRAARGLYLAEFTPGESLRRLVGIYEDVAAGLGPSPVAR